MLQTEIQLYWMFQSQSIQMTDSNKNDDGKKLLLRYAGFATQLLVGLGIGVLIGYFVDKKINIAVPVFTWLLPLLILIVMFLKVIKDTSTK
jgi:F0F1-type ATP synthase assembly protein I